MQRPFLFVSHVSEDHGHAMELVGELERRGVPCWIAPRNVRAGRPYDDEIAQAIDDCAGMLLVFSEHCNSSDYIRREVTVAGEARKLIIPFRIEDAQPKRGLRVRLADLHWIDGFMEREQAIESVMRGFHGKPTETGSTSREDSIPEDRDAGTAPGGAIDALRRAAEAGDARSQFVLAYRLKTGDGVAKDAVKAIQWFEKASEQGYVEAQVSLGLAYEQGQGVTQDYALAVKWYDRAAAQKNPRALWSLGLLHELGQGVAVDLVRAADLYGEAARQGFAPAEYHLGRLREEGRGVDRDIDLALALYERAAAKGHGEAARALQRLRGAGSS